MLNKLLKSKFTEGSFLFTLGYAIAVPLSCWLAMQISLIFISNPNNDQATISGLWSGLSAVLVIQVTLQSTYKSAQLRVAGSALGSLFAFICSHYMGYSLITLACTILIQSTLLSLVGWIKFIRLANLTALVIILVGMISSSVPPLFNSSLRFIDSIVGTLVALVIVLIFSKVLKMTE